MAYVLLSVCAKHAGTLRISLFFLQPPKIRAYCADESISAFRCRAPEKYGFRRCIAHRNLPPVNNEKDGHLNSRYSRNFIGNGLAFDVPNLNIYLINHVITANGQLLIEM